MDSMLVVVFDDETKAFAGTQTLLQLDGDGSISIYGYAVVTKRADGTVTVKYGDDPGQSCSSWTSLGSIVGHLGGPTSLALGATTGEAAGPSPEPNKVSESDDFIDDVTKVLLPNRVAVVAEIGEEWTTPVDTRMERIGGIVFRWALPNRNGTNVDIAAMKADFDQMKAQHAEARADRKAKHQKKIKLPDSDDQYQDPADNDLPSDALLGE